MGSEPRVDPGHGSIDLPVLQKFKLYETPSNWYLIGRDEKKTFRRILKIDRRDQNELNIFEDPTNYTNKQMTQIKRWLKLGNMGAGGGFTPYITCYGIIGFVRFLAPYYMLVITKRKKVGEICGHTIYSIVETKMITIPNYDYQTKVADSKDENRYKKLLSMVDLSKDFYFSHTYHLMYSLQKNICNTERGKEHYDKMFVWNAHLTRGIRRILKNTTWTVALIYGFFEQIKCSVSGEEFVLTVIARRSRHYAGTRYLRRGVNAVGRVANDVETEQIVSKEVPKGEKIPITSVVQVRGSIPLYWSQETSLFNPQPEFTLNKKDLVYKATRYHFENLELRYGKQIMVLNLLKTEARKHRESVLWTEYDKAVRFINRRVKKDYNLNVIHFDLNKQYKSEGAPNAFDYLCIFARKALALNNIFFCKAPSGVGGEDVINDSFADLPLPPQDEEAISLEKEAADIIMLQNGVLRTNCIDCLDRTNFAQYTHGLIALAHQLHTLDITGPPIVDIENPLALKLMDLYLNMGNIISLQYSGTGAHTKIFDDLKGSWNMASTPHRILIGVTRHYNNAYHDKEKQSAINLFLGHFRPQLGMPQIWELDGDQNSMARTSSNLDIDHMKALRRTVSDTMLVEEPLSEGLSETSSGSAFYQTEPASLSFRMEMSSPDHLRGKIPNEMAQGSSSPDSRRPNDVPGYAHSYDTKFVPAEQTFKAGSTRSLVDASFTSMTDTDSSIDGGSNRSGTGARGLLAPGFSDDFHDWVESTKQW